MRTQMLTIVRGLPGSGKTTQGSIVARLNRAKMIDPDEYLTTPQGLYIYSPERFRQAVLRGMASLELAAKEWRDTVWCDVLPRRHDVERLATSWRLACDSEAKCVVRVFTMRISPIMSMARNIHHVREDDIRRMAEEWEDFPGEAVFNAEVRR